MRLASNLRTYALLFVLSICCLAHGQQLGSINGSVTDPSGSVIVNAEVTVTQVSTKEDHGHENKQQWRVHCPCPD